MRSGTKEILLAGTALVAAGIVLGVLTFQAIKEESHSTRIIENFSSGGSVTEDINMVFVDRFSKAAVNISLLIDSEPSKISMKAKVRQPDGTLLHNTDFNDDLFTTFSDTGGEHVNTVVNPDQEPVTLRIETGSPYLNSEMIISRNIGLSIFMIFVGMIVLIYGGIIFQIRGRFRKIETATPETRPVGIVIYTLLTGFAAIIILGIVYDFVTILLSGPSNY